MINQYLMHLNASLDMGLVKSKVSTLPTSGVSDYDKYWLTTDNSINIYCVADNGWTKKIPTNGMHFLLESDGKYYFCHNGVFNDVTAGADAATVNGHKVETDVPSNAKFTDTTYTAGQNISIDSNNVISSIQYDDTQIKQDVLNLQANSHNHLNKSSLDKISEDINGNFTYNGNTISQDIPTATNEQLGVVKPDGTTITIDANGTISSNATSGTTDYTTLTNKPSINGIELNGSNTLSDLGIQPIGDYASKSQIPDVSTKLETSNFHAGIGITLNKVGNDITINSTVTGGGSSVKNSTINGNILIDDIETKVYTLPSDIARTSDIPDISTKLEVSNLTAGDNITITPTTGNNLTISANASSTDSVARQSIVDLRKDVDDKADEAHSHTILEVMGLQAALDSKIDNSQVGTVNGLATLDSDGKVVSSQLPNTYQLSLGETNLDAYYGDKGKIAYDHSQLVSGNPHSVTKLDVGLGNVANVDTTTTANISDSFNKRFITDAQKTSLSNLSGTNSGDETSATIKTKLGSASSTTDGYITSADWNIFNNKVDKVANSSLVANTEIAKIHPSFQLGTKILDETNIGNGKVIKYDSSTGGLIYDDATAVTATDMTVNEIATIVTDIQQSTNSTPVNLVITRRDLRDVVKFNNDYLVSQKITPNDMSSEDITNVLDDIWNSTSTTATNTVATRLDVRDLVKGNNEQMDVLLDVKTTEAITNRLSYFDIGQDSTIGSITTILGNTPPQHYLKMDGSIYNISDYQDLATFIQIQFGEVNHFGGDGVTTFAVPNSTPPIPNAINCIKYEKVFYLAGVKTEMIFSGNANVINTTYSLSKSYDRYKYLLVVGGASGGTSVTNSALISVDSIISSGSQFSVGYFHLNSYYWNLYFGFISTSTFRISSFGQAGWSGSAISKIYGIY